MIKNQSTSLEELNGKDPTIEKETAKLDNLIKRIRQRSEHTWWISNDSSGLRILTVGTAEKPRAREQS